MGKKDPKKTLVIPRICRINVRRLSDRAWHHEMSSANTLMHMRKISMPTKTFKFFLSIAHAWAWVIFCIALPGCDFASSEIPSTAHGTTATTQQNFTWPTDPDTGALRQVTKHIDDKTINPSLILMSSLPHRQMPDRDITPIGVSRITTAELEQLFVAERWAFVDVRKDRDLREKGTIPGSYHAEYKFEGSEYKGATRLTQRTMRRLLEDYDGVVFFCNGPKCPRSFNACVVAVQAWGVPGSRIRWYHNGVPAWRKTPLNPTARQPLADKGP